METRVTKLIPAALLLLGICAACAGPSEEEQAVERLRKRQTSGFVRIVNLTDRPSDFVMGGKTLMAKVDPDRSSVFLANPAGATTLESALLSDPVQFDLKAKDCASVFLVGSEGSVANHLVTGEPRLVGDAKAMVTFVLADADGGPYTAKPSNGSEITLEAFKASPALDIPPGEFQASVSGPGGVKIPVQLRAQEHGAYTVVIYRKGGEPSALVLNNHPDMNVTAVGAAAG